MESAPIQRPRAKLFRRADAPKGMELTARDLTMLAHIARHRFLSSANLAALDGGSPQGVLRCLRVLYDHGYVDRPATQLATMQLAGPRPFVYGLGRKGARALREHGHQVNDRIDWSEKNKRAGGIFMEHTLAIADFMVGVELAARDRDDLWFIRESEIIELAPDRTRAARESLRWEVESFHRGRKERWSVVPDGLFGLSFADSTSAYFLLEIDQGTIPIARRGSDHRSIRRKLQTYYDGWCMGRHEAQFGVKQVRVAFVTTSVQRVEHMLKAVEDVTDGRGSNFFLFIDKRSLLQSDPLAAIWTTGKGELIRLTD